MRNILKSFIVILPFALFFEIQAQDSSSIKKSNFNFSGYLETYFCYDFSNPVNHLREPFFYSFNLYCLSSKDKNHTRHLSRLHLQNYCIYLNCQERDLMGIRKYKRLPEHHFH